MASHEAPSDSARYAVLIEDEVHPWNKDTISVEEIRQLGGFPSGANLVAVDLASGAEHPLSEDSVHSVPPQEPDKPLVKKTNFKRTG